MTLIDWKYASQNHRACKENNTVLSEQVRQNARTVALSKSTQVWAITLFPKRGELTANAPCCSSQFHQKCALIRCSLNRL